MIVDAHSHVLPPAMRKYRDRYIDRDDTFALLHCREKNSIKTAEELVQSMDSSGINVSVIMGYGWTDQSVAREVNDYLLEAAHAFPGRLIPFCSVNPGWGDRAVIELERCMRAGSRGIGELHPGAQGFSLTDRGVIGPILGIARQWNAPVLIHTSEPVGHNYPGKDRTGPEILGRFLEEFSDNKIIFAHWGAGLPFYALMPEVAQLLRNVYFDSAASGFLYNPDVFATVAHLVGSERVLWGTDYPLLSHKRMLDEISRSGLSSEERNMVMGENAAHLLGIVENEHPLG